MNLDFMKEYMQYDKLKIKDSTKDFINFLHYTEKHWIVYTRMFLSVAKCINKYKHK